MNRVESLPASGTTGPTRSLVGVGLTDGGDLQGVHTHLGVVHFEFGVSGIDHIENAVHYRSVSQVDR